MATLLVTVFKLQQQINPFTSFFTHCSDCLDSQKTSYSNNLSQLKCYLQNSNFQFSDLHKVSGKLLATLSALCSSEVQSMPVS